MRRAFAVAILLLMACGSASDEEVKTTVRAVPAEGSVQEAAESTGAAWIWTGSETAPHDLDADAAACGETHDADLASWTQCMYAKGWLLETR